MSAVTPDLVVVGAGPVGMYAAALARRRGLDVLLVEADDVLGGSASRGDGTMWLPDPGDDARQYVSALAGAGDGLRDTVVAHGRAVRDSLADLGVRLLQVPEPDAHAEPGAGRGRIWEPAPTDARRLKEHRGVLRIVETSITYSDTLRANHNPRFDAIRYNTGATADAAFAAWTQGRTGFPIVDAGMRQLLAQGWVHNRVRMIVASFLTKDLHLPWWWGARHFMAHLVDGDLAANQHGWQWTAGSGTDAAPYFRVFNPTRQGEKFDPDGDYVRRWVPELRAVAGMQVHQLPGVRPPGYPDPIVDHAVERKEALARYREV